MQVWLTSDLHVSHINIIKYADRPFTSVEEMNAALVELWNATVAPSDYVFVLGDAAMGKLDDSLPILGQMQGHKVLVPGNHDRLHPMHKAKKGFNQWESRYLNEAGFEKIWPVEQRTDIGAKRGRVTFCHFPFEGDSHDEDRFNEWRPEDKGGWLIHGHVHSAWRQRGRQVNVGIDAHGGKLLPVEEVTTLVDRGVVEDLPRIPW
jgi:calcineurin-like phosphoesterase family protein